MMAKERTPREKDIERQLAIASHRSGGLALKFTSPSMAGVPDRLLLLPGGRAAFAELKAPGKCLRPLQKKRKQQLMRYGNADRRDNVRVDYNNTKQLVK